VMQVCNLILSIYTNIYIYTILLTLLFNKRLRDENLLLIFTENEILNTLNFTELSFFDNYTYENKITNHHFNYFFLLFQFFYSLSSFF